MNVRLTSLFHEDLDDAFAFYQAQKPGLGDELLVEFRRALGLAIEWPVAWPVLEGNYRRVLLHRFPYAIIYLIEGDEIVAAAFAHLKRRPGYWKRG